MQTAVNELTKCRQTLKWTYAMAHFLVKGNSKTMFEDIQAYVPSETPPLVLGPNPTDQLFFYSCSSTSPRFPHVPLLDVLLAGSILPGRWGGPAAPLQNGSTIWWFQRLGEGCGTTFADVE